MKKIIIIIDGVSDLPIKELGNKTPLDIADTPHMDFLAKWGETGIMYPIKKGWAPESDQSMISMLGFDPFKTYTGRGVLEAYGSGIEFNGKVVCRCNFSKVNKAGTILAIQGATDSQSKRFVKILNKLRPDVRLIPTIGYRSVMLIDTKSSPRVTNTHPGYVITKNYCSQAQPIAGRKLKIRKCMPLVKEAKKTADIINNFIKSTERKLHGYDLITRGTGDRLPKLGKLKGKWALLADMPVEKAIGKLVGMTVLPKYLDLNKTFNIIKKNFKKFDCFYLQIKGPDMFGHLGMPKKKKKSIEEIDEKFISKIRTLPFDVICVTADHSTPCSLKAHSKDPVPILVYGKGKDSVKKFSEKACEKGSLGFFEGKNLLKKI